MGCSFCSHCVTSSEVEEENTPKEYSWDKREKVDINDFTISDVSDEVYRMPGSVNGQQLVIQNCTNAFIYVFDHINSINIDDCTNCKIVLGPIKGSLFARKCSNCVIVAACGQFRLRDSYHLEIFLSCATQPIIESSSQIKFACFRMYYHQLKDHLEAAGLSVYNNLWNNVHDFTPVEGESNWKMLPKTVSLRDYLPPPLSTELKSVGWSITGEPAVIPVSEGMPNKPFTEMCLVLTFSSGEKEHTKLADLFLSTLQQENMQCRLLTCREVQLQTPDAVALQLSMRSQSNVLEDGPVVGLILGGDNCVDSCQLIVNKLSGSGLIYASSDSETAQRQVHTFLQCASMHLGC